MYEAILACMEIGVTLFVYYYYKKFHTKKPETLNSAQNIYLKTGNSVDICYRTNINQTKHHEHFYKFV